MKLLPIILTAILLAAGCGDAREYAFGHRWFYVSSALTSDKDVAAITKLIDTASEHGLNGMVLSANLDMLDRQPEDYFKRLARVKRACDERQIEIIPMIFSVGYGGGLLAHDKNLAAGLQVTDALFVAKDGKADLVADPPVAFTNGGLEEAEGDRVTGYRLQDGPGKMSFVDRHEKKRGEASLRFEQVGKSWRKHGRLMQDVAVRPHRFYKVSFYVRTDELEPAGSLRCLVLAPDERNLAPWDAGVSSNNGWTKIVMGFNSMQYDQVSVYVGTWGARKGSFWIDELAIEEVGLLNVLRRPGTPLAVKSESTGRAYEEGRDYAPIKDKNLSFLFDHDPVSIVIPPNSRIAEGERLRVSFYHGITIYKHQVPVCMSEPALYDIFKTQVKLIHQHLKPRTWFLSMDEIRAGGTCEACVKRNMTMAQMFGDCVTRECDMIKGVNPDAEIVCWSDMLDPNHNAHDNFYLTAGDFTGSWNYVPKDLIIACWYFDKRKQSLDFFSKEGFRTVAGTYYDLDDLSNSEGWLSALNKTPGAYGIMYTTWYNKYDLLGAFGDLVGKQNLNGR